MSTSTPASFVVAHRAGNDLERLRAAEALRLPLVEADVHLFFGGRLEVRHRKTVGPIPILWDRWQLAPPWAPRMLLDELLSPPAGGTELMLDLKGHDRRLPERVAWRDRVRVGPRRVTVCSQDWRLLEPFERGPASASCTRSATRGSLRGCAALDGPRGRLDPPAAARRRRRSRTSAGAPRSSCRGPSSRSRRLAGWPLGRARA